MFKHSVPLGDYLLSRTGDCEERRTQPMILQLLSGGGTGVHRTGEILDEFPINHHPVCIEKKVRIRNYREADRSTIRRLCCDTGFLGNPVDSVFQDRELFADLFTKPYLNHEP